MKLLLLLDALLIELQKEIFIYVVSVGMSHIIHQTFLSKLLLLGQLVSVSTSNLAFIKRSVHNTDVSTENNWTFELE